MNRLSKILLAITIILLIGLGGMTYYMLYWRSAYFTASNQLTENLDFFEDAGVTIKSKDDGPAEVIIKKQNKVVFEDAEME